MKSNDFLADVKPSRISNRAMAAIAADPETYKRHYENDPAETKALALEIKQRITIKDLAHLCPGWECQSGMSKSPFRNEKNASFSVSDDYRKFYDFADDTYKGDVFDFVRFATGCDAKEAFRTLLAMAGLGDVPRIIRAPVQRHRAAELDSVPTRFVPALRVPNHDALKAIQALRGIGIDALAIAVRRNLLWTALFNGHLAWVLTDYTRKAFLARRLDGKVWEHLPTKPKAWLLKGSKGNWPIGIKETAAYPSIALCEGGPDFLSVFEFAMRQGVADLVAPVCKASASGDIDSYALRYFTEKRVRIFVHDDDAGYKAAAKWTRQLRTVNAKVDGYRFDGLTKADGKRVEDLNDLLFLSDECYREHAHITEAMMDFIGFTIKGDK
jgi:hypothetical protein